MWKRHGALVASATPYLPSSFDRPPRNPAKKINSGYKATEFLLYLWGLGPAVFRLVLPGDLWSHFCKLVCAIRLLYQRRIAWEELGKANQMILEWENEFELRYYAREVDRLHLMRPSLHAILHAAHETARCGPLNLIAQWALENTIGNLGREVNQPSNPFSNLAERTLLRARLNALAALVPHLNPERPLSDDNHNLKNGYILLSGRDKYSWRLPDAHISALKVFLTQVKNEVNCITKIQRWARLQLPNGQQVRSRWSEDNSKRNTRVTHNVKIQ